MSNWSTCLRNTSRCHVYFPSQIQYRTGQRWSCCSHMGVEKTPAFSAAPVLSSCQDPVHGVVTGHRCPVAPHVPRISLKVCPCPSPADPNQPSRLQPFTPTRIDLLAIKRRRGDRWPGVEALKPWQPAGGRVKWQRCGKRCGGYKRLNIEWRGIQQLQFRVHNQKD